MLYSESNCDTTGCVIDSESDPYAESKGFDCDVCDASELGDGPRAVAAAARFGGILIASGGLVFCDTRLRMEARLWCRP